jgi:parvulin-like peptidyl-prolyl isomerase
MLFYDLNSAYVALDYLQEGRDFAQLATTFDPQARGYLGWFPQGYLTIPELDPILFSMEVGETSDIIETDIGFHIIKVLDKETDRPLDPTIRQQFQEKALDEWLEQQWKLSTIEITVP